LLTTQDIAKVNESADFIKASLPVLPEVAMILGSGLGVLADSLENPVTMDYKAIPHFPLSTVEGHAGQFVVGELSGKQVVIMKGRFHMYEGYTAAEVTFPIRVLKKLGVKTLIVTNAAGGINTEYASGELMIIKDHINFTSRNPLIGPNLDEFGVRFPDMSEAYSKRLRAIAHETAATQGFALQEGIYVGLLGPSYETPAEIRMFRILGADAVGMSTVSEVLVARHSGIEVLGISCISNMAAGILDQALSHEEVMETTERVKGKFLALVKGIVPQL
jgi:purine-nucleoside phosphorylase